MKAAAAWLPRLALAGACLAPWVAGAQERIEARLDELGASSAEDLQTRHSSLAGELLASQERAAEQLREETAGRLQELEAGLRANSDERLSESLSRLQAAARSPAT